MKLHISWPDGEFEASIPEDTVKVEIGVTVGSETRSHLTLFVLTANYSHATQNFTYYPHATQLYTIYSHATLLLALTLRT